jgi:hypothetical protein
VQSNGIALALHGEAQHGASQLIGLLADRLDRPLRAASFWLQIGAYSVPEQNQLAFRAVFCAANFEASWNKPPTDQNDYSPLIMWA